MKTLMIVAVFAIAVGFTYADETQPVRISVIGQTNDVAGRSFASVQVTNAAAKPYYFVYLRMVPSGSDWSRARNGWLNEASVQTLAPGTATNFLVLAPENNDRWRIKLRYNPHPQDVTPIEKITSTGDILENNK